MPRDGSGVYSKPAGTTASPNTTIESSKYNAFGDDLAADANAARPITAGGTGSTTAAAARAALATAGLADENTFSKTQIWAKGADVASTNTLTIGDDGNYFDITGTTAITSIAAVGVGAVIKLHFDGALVLTHHATDLALPGGGNITTAAGDEAEFVEYAAGDWRCTNFQRASVQPYILHLVHEAASGVDGGTAVTGANNIRPITAKVNTIPGATVGADTFSLPAGTYDIDGWGAGYNVRWHKAFIRNDTIPDLALVGSSEYAASDSSTNSIISGRLVVASGGEAFSLRHYIGVGYVGEGLGIATGASLTERYASLMIRRVQ